MIWKPNPLALVGIAMVSAPIIAHAKIYITAEQAQKILFPNKILAKYPIITTDDLQEKMRIASSIRHPFQGDRIWKSADGSWLVIDEVVGKHEMITYAVAFKPNGSIAGIEVLEYVESYGYEVAEAQWRKQFVGKTANDPIKLNQDIQNIGGATLSCKHLTDGIKRVAVLYDLALKNASQRITPVQMPKAK
ncbi:FMN-binding protein [Polynucleobacter sp. AP-Kaivos-20-H2]|jgi:Na+-translocating ferredoxin:NAD+ oxidoreductase RnfG subunit|uniref:FMN-binding protein n=1 Tax=Polynucleobacter sp. AP-Kaivos-20-H2 TaxID=2689104 RepID=UPI001C0CCE74|nr:FMN-binding protein [Polynucleobacter sp. AP-Kaivos-20-H2]MBU3604046.1 FMN-binding protein [Polynucleobacter sp. AP-Kaivos-20-H2]